MSVEKIVILTDFSEASTHLLHYGVALAQHLQAQVWIQHVYYIPPTAVGDVYIPFDTLTRYGESILDKCDRLKKNDPVLQAENIQFVVTHGDLVTEMNKLIQQEQISLVIVGNRGGGFLNNILGSNTVKVIQHARCPVLSIPEGTEFCPFRRIALAIDLQTTSSKVLSHVISFIQMFRGKVDIVHVSTAPVPVDVPQLIHSLDLGLEGVPHELFHIHTSDVEKGIERHIAGNNNDLLILLPKAHPFFDRLFQKSISRQAVYQKKIPLLSIHL